ncbi:MAG: indole-3-glycerol phosphate synthase TrpC [candidate division KSB1 bacterium]|nr:indole-3-glycerol phosphate synthase TrpC [candidate division KSB1 bacterium]MDZ7357150.1 indole-3-glycerol phosphate synthase TrpC [candidate division KSB1 bacterium]MDZ7400218.1 indole-3-glycerol phosphate synthase TrpC [candidate division KSB1 bacterium]
MNLYHIVQKVKERIREQKKIAPMEWYQSPRFPHQNPNLFKQAFEQPGIQLIAEIKRASPTAGTITKDFDPAAIALDYATAGAAAISVVTEPDFFQGSLEILNKVRQVVSIPLLRKDFIIDPYQIYQARYFGANCVLLIASILSDDELKEFSKLAADLQMNVLLEIHDEQELDRALPIETAIIGINNRDLKTFQVDLHTSFRLIEKIPSDRIVVSESGIKDHHEVKALEQAGFKGILVGEFLMRLNDKRHGVESLLGNTLTQNKKKDHFDPPVAEERPD